MRNDKGEIVGVANMEMEGIEYVTLAKAHVMLLIVYYVKYMNLNYVDFEMNYETIVKTIESTYSSHIYWGGIVKNIITGLWLFKNVKCIFDSLCVT